MPCLAGVAQTAEHGHGKAGVRGSIPRASSRGGVAQGQSKRLIIAVSAVRIRPPLRGATSLARVAHARTRRYTSRSPDAIEPFDGPLPPEENIRRNVVAKAENRPGITLACEDCKRRNYQTSKNKQNDRDRIALKKYCRWCR